VTGRKYPKIQFRPIYCKEGAVKLGVQGLGLQYKVEEKKRNVVFSVLFHVESMAVAVFAFLAGGGGAVWVVAISGSSYGSAGRWVE
jgi:hypothetical protein